MVGKEFEVLEICFFSLVKLVRVGLGSDVWSDTLDLRILHIQICLFVLL